MMWWLSLAFQVMVLGDEIVNLLKVILVLLFLLLLYGLLKILGSDGRLTI